MMIVSLFAACKSKPPSMEPEETPETEPAEITEDVKIERVFFDVVSIVIIQADLINTQFKAVVRIDNPNTFAVNISSFSYELYGNGIFWASGTEKGLLQIPAMDSFETEFRFTMNFINMNRRLLDDIITMRRVRYSFFGEATVETGIPHLPSFRVAFERSGESEVMKKDD
ncbi:MAG: LEA type 2 family protein [Treponema sp.]|nr:LEA type 2 family protein [Treponema sp.]